MVGASSELVLLDLDPININHSSITRWLLSRLALQCFATPGQSCSATNCLDHHWTLLQLGSAVATLAERDSKRASRGTRWKWLEWLLKWAESSISPASSRRNIHLVTWSPKKNRDLLPHAISVSGSVSVSQLPGPNVHRRVSRSATPPPPWPFDAMAARHRRAALSAAAKGKLLFDQKLGLCPFSEQLGDPQLIQKCFQRFQSMRCRT